VVLPLSLSEARTYAAASCFRTGPVGRVGVELEWLVYDAADPLRRVPLDELRSALDVLPAVLPGGGLVTVEPGGQVELSSAPGPDLVACAEATAADLGVLRSAIRTAGLRLAGSGLDSDRPPHRVLDTPRYAALEAFYDRFGGPGGRAMMANSASVQVCLDAGDDSDGVTGYRFRWALADALGPVLMAAFANSPAWAGRRTGWRSTRQRFRFGTDPGRSRAPRRSADPRAAWARYALDARVVCVRDEPSGGWAVPDMTFRQWLLGAGPRPATLDDLEFHLGTLFPPVRPRGYLELRMIDAQAGDGWIVPLAVVTALFDDPVAAQTAAALASRRPVRRHAEWLRAARYGLADPQVAAVALGCFEAAGESLARTGAPAAIRAAVADFTDRYPARGRCPADDALVGAHPAEHQPT
jgi:glutamate--cysteine ligase